MANRKRVIKLACVYPRVGDCVSKTFENSRVDLATNRTVFFTDVDWLAKAYTNTLSNNLDNALYTIQHYDLDEIKVHNPKKEGKAITLEEFISGIKESLAESWKGREIKFVADDSTKKELKKLVDSGVITKDNIVTAEIEKNHEVNLDPFAGLNDEEVVPESVDIKSLSDLRETVTTAKNKSK